MTDCNHSNTSMQTCQEKILGELFKFEAERCTTCGSSAWNSTTFDQFHDWLEALYKRTPDKFMLQKIKLPKPIWDYIYHDLKKEIRGEIKISTVIKTATWIYIKAVARDQDVSTQIENYFATQDHEFIAREKANTKLRFNPNFFLEIHQWSTRLGMSEKEFVENAVARVLYGAKLHDEIKRSLIDRLEAA